MLRSLVVLVGRNVTYNIGLSYRLVFVFVVRILLASDKPYALLHLTNFCGLLAWRQRRRYRGSVSG